MSEAVHEEAYPAAEFGGGYEPVRVVVMNPHPAPAKCGCSGAKRRSFVARTFTLAALPDSVGGGTQTQQILPRSTSRVDAWITSITSLAAGAPAPIPAIFVAKSESDAQQQSGATAILYGTNLTGGVQTGSPDVPFEINTTDEIWVSGLAAALPITVSVMAFYEQEEN